MAKKCIDVFSGNGKIDWSKVKNAGVAYAIIRATIKTNDVDSQFVNNINGCVKYTIPFDVYKYSYAKTTSEVKKEIDIVVELLKKHSIKGCYIWWDVEDPSIRSLGKNKITELIKFAEKCIVEAGYKFGLYCGLDWYQNVLDVDKLNYVYWIARYPSTKTMELNTAPDDKYKPSIKHEMWGWQYTGTGSVPGVSGDCDITIMYDVKMETKTEEKEVITVSDIDKVVEVAEAEVGYLEKSSKAKYTASVGRSDEKTYGAGSSNWTKYGAWIGCNGDYWCASFVSWIFYKAFGQTNGKKILTTYSPACEDIRGTIPKVSTPQRGDIIFFKGTRHAGANHIGLITKVTSGYIYTIEGNTSGGSSVVDNGGGVAKKCYEKGYEKILSYGRPKYTNVGTTTPATSTPTTKDANGCPYAKPTKTLKYGMSDDGIKWMKWYLDKLIDANILMATKLDHTNNYWGDTTAATVKAFQTYYPTTGTNSYKPDGLFGTKCVDKAFSEVSKINAMKTYEEANPNCYLPKSLPACGYWQKGDETIDTLRIKKFLLWVYPNSGITITTNLYGDNTVKYVKAFQSAHGINPSGYWNKSTQLAAQQYKK